MAGTVECPLCAKHRILFIISIYPVCIIILILPAKKLRLENLGNFPQGSTNEISTQDFLWKPMFSKSIARAINK